MHTCTRRCGARSLQPHPTQPATLWTCQALQREKDGLERQLHRAHAAADAEIQELTSSYEGHGGTGARPKAPPPPPSLAASVRPDARRPSSPAALHRAALWA